MKIWIGHVSCGLGHGKAAEAIRDVFEPEQACFFFDLLDCAPAFVKRVYSQGYAFLVKYCPSFWQLLFWFNSFRAARPGIDFLHQLLFKRFIASLIKEDPGVVISTHFFVSQIVSLLKGRGLIHSRLITVITDFGVYPLWVNKNTDYYVAASDEVAARLRTVYAVPEETIKVWGIPLRRQFFAATDVRAGSKERFTFLLFGSGLGLGPLKAIIEALSKEASLLVIYGKNRSAEKYIKGLKDDRHIRTLAATEAIAPLMDEADVVVTKAGGLSVSESLARRRPIIFMSVIAGQEDYNVDFVVSKGLGFRPRSIPELIAALIRLKDDPSELKKIKDNLDKLVIHDSALKIRDLVLSLSG